MTIYFILIGYIIFSPLIIGSFVRDRDKLKKKVLLFSLIGIFLVLALKAPSVGRDTLGYKIMYDNLSRASWNNFHKYYWTETGFEFLEMLFSHILRADYQLFSISIYAFICFSYYKFLDHYAEDVTLSLLIYICFGFIVFDISGIRFALSLAVYLFAIPFAQKKGLKNLVFYFVIVLLDTQIHKGAYFCFFLYFVIRFPFKGWIRFLYIGFPAAMFLFKPLLNSYIALYSNQRMENGVSIGGNVLFYILVLLMVFLLALLWRREKARNPQIFKERNVFAYKDIGVQTRLFYVGTVLVTVIGESTLVRTANYGLFLMISLLPNVISKFDFKSKLLMRSVLVLFLVSYFLVFKIIPNDLDIGPYVFFWNY